MSFQTVSLRPQWLQCRNKEYLEVEKYPFFSSLPSSKRSHAKGILSLKSYASKKSNESFTSIKSYDSLTDSAQKVGSIYFFSSAFLLFNLVTFDVFSPYSVHLLSYVDQNIHIWVQSHVPTYIQNIFFDKLLSSACIAFPLIVWFTRDLLNGGLNLMFSRSNFRLGLVTISGEALSFILKVAFHRQRPRLDIHSFSYPSSHTLSTVVIVGMFIFLKLQPQSKNKDSLKENTFINSTMPTAIWFLVAVIIGLFRIFADAHWFSDTIAGASLGFSLVSLLLMIKQKDA